MKEPTIPRKKRAEHVVSKGKVLKDSKWLPWGGRREPGGLVKSPAVRYAPSQGHDLKQVRDSMWGQSGE